MKLKNLFSKLFGPSRAQLEHKVAALIAEGKIPEAMQVLLDAGHTEAALLKAQWDALMLRQQSVPNFDWESFTITQNRITYALLELSKPKKPAPGGIEHGDEDIEYRDERIENTELLVLTEEQRNQLRQMLKEDRWQEALEMGKDWSNDMTLLHSRYKSIDRHYHLGLVTAEFYQNTQKEILSALHHFTSEIYDPAA